MLRSQHETADRGGGQAGAVCFGLAAPGTMRGDGKGASGVAAVVADVWHVHKCGRLCVFAR